MAKQNLKRRIARETNEVCKAALIARLNPQKEINLWKRSNPQKEAIVKTDNEVNVEHEHGAGCEHHNEMLDTTLSAGEEHRYPNVSYPGGGGDGRK